VLEDRHVAAHLAEATEGDDAQALVGQRRGRTEFGVRVAHRAPSLRSVGDAPDALPMVRSLGSLT
jgi:hypothetical protein